MTTQNLNVELETGVYDDYLILIRAKCDNPALTAEECIKEYIKRQVKVYRFHTVTNVQKETLIDMTGL